MAKQDHEETPEAAGDESRSTRPIVRFSGTGGINAAVWKHKTDSGVDHYSVRLDRTYKNDADQYESTGYLREGDLLRAQKLLGAVDDWIEQDRAKHRQSQRQTGAER
jgi:hypothetical protein